MSFPTDLEIVADLNLTVLSEWASLSSTLNLDSDTPRTCAVSLAVAKRDLIRAFISEVYIDVPNISIALSRRAVNSRAAGKVGMTFIFLVFKRHFGTGNRAKDPRRRTYGIFAVDFEPAFGIDATFTCLRIEIVEAVPCDAAVNEQGEEIYPRKWNHEFIDLPQVANQRTPTFTVDEIPKIVLAADGQFRVLYALLGGTGLRIGEALALEVKDISESTITVRQGVWNGILQTPKTSNGLRDVDRPPWLWRYRSELRKRAQGRDRPKHRWCVNYNSAMDDDFLELCGGFDALMCGKITRFFKLPLSNELGDVGAGTLVPVHVPGEAYRWTLICHCG